MAAFNTKKVLYGSPSLIPVIANELQSKFQADGYEVIMDALSSGGYDISITKGNIFKAILGMKTALKITLLPQGGNIHFEAGVGIFGKQVIPTLIMWYVAWPVLLTQIWGLVQQAKLDDEALNIAEDVVYKNNNNVTAPTNSNSGRFCTSCGTPNTASANFCCGCGKPL